MIKASAGGGGRGMRRCDDVADAAALTQLIESARAEARDLLRQRRRCCWSAWSKKRATSNCRSSATRTAARCTWASATARPSAATRRSWKKRRRPASRAALRARMGDAAVKLVREVGYVGAGTVEFLLTPDGEFHFLEMNTRLQVEHPVTEAITGLDLVEWQLRIARGEPIPLQQADIRWQRPRHRGAAVRRGRLQRLRAAGRAQLLHWNVPAGEGIRVDHGMVAQPTIPPYYDSMIAKVIAYGADREQARGRLQRALAGSSVLGLRHQPRLPAAGAGRTGLCHAAAGHALARRGQPGVDRAPARCALGGAGGGAAAAPSGAGLRPAGAVEFDRRARHATAPGRGRPVVRSAPGLPPRRADRNAASATRRHSRRDTARRWHDGAADRRRRRTCACRPRCRATQGWLDADGICAAWTDLSQAPPVREDEASHGLDHQPHARRAGEAGRSAAGQRVRKGEFVLAIEAMKMEHRIEAPIAGTVVEIGATAGTQVSPGRLLVRIEADAGLKENRHVRTRRAVRRRKRRGHAHDEPSGGAERAQRQPARRPARRPGAGQGRRRRCARCCSLAPAAASVSGADLAAGSAITRPARRGADPCASATTRSSWRCGSFRSRSSAPSTAWPLAPA